VMKRVKREKYAGKDQFVATARSVVEPETLVADFEDAGCDSVPAYLKAVERIHRQLGDIYAAKTPSFDLPLTPWPDAPRTHRCAVDSRPDIEAVYNWAYVESMRRMVAQQLESSGDGKLQTYQGLVTQLDKSVDLGHAKVRQVVVLNRVPEEAMVWVWFAGIGFALFLLVRIFLAFLRRAVVGHRSGNYIRR